MATECSSLSTTWWKGQEREEKQPSQEAVGRQSDVVLRAGRERLDSTVSKRFISQEKSGSAELLCPCRVQYGKGRTEVDADAASLVFLGTGQHREGV